MFEECTDCYYCGEAHAVTLCEGCGIPLCAQCVKLEDSIFAKDDKKLETLCPDCFSDPSINAALEFE